MALRSALWRLGLRFRIGRGDLPGRPDIVFSAARVLVFCDGDFWHGRNLAARLRHLRDGHNAPYWVAKIRTNVKRDRRNTGALAGLGWTVLRFWESDIAADPQAIAREVARMVRRRGRRARAR